jgi:peroxiredoxin
MAPATTCRALPPVALPSTAGVAVDLSTRRGRLVVYCFPRAGQPDVPSPKDWDQIPGARGCTPQSLAFRAQHQEIQALGADLFGLSTQTPAAQAEIATRLRLPFPLLSDAGLAFGRALRLPTFEVEGQTLIRRFTLIATDGAIEQVFYPVFPPDANAAEVVAWLQAHPRRPGTRT